MARFYEDADSLFVRAYDAFYSGERPQFADDVAFYERLAREAGGGVLELACGTGRIALPLAERGLSVTGVDLSEGMLQVARDKLKRLPPPVQARLSLIRQDMTELNLPDRFAFAFIPARSFQHLLTPDEQRKSLRAIRHHLQPGGRLALHLFDPRFDLLIDENGPFAELAGVDAVTRHRFVGKTVHTRFDHLAQIRRDLWHYAEIDANGEVLAEDTREMVLRWTYRWELRYLLSLCGFTVETECSDFAGSAPAYGKELIIVSRIG